MAKNVSCHRRSSYLHQFLASFTLLAGVVLSGRAFGAPPSPAPDAAERWSNDKGLVGVLSGTALFLPSSKHTGPAAPQLTLALGPNFSLRFKPSIELGWASVPLDAQLCPGCDHLDVFHLATRVRIAFALDRVLLGPDLSFGVDMPSGWMERRGSRLLNHPSDPHCQLAGGGFLWLTSSEKGTTDMERVRGLSIERLAQGYKDSCKSAADAAACKSTVTDIQDLVESRRRNCAKPVVNYVDGLDDAELNAITDYGICIQEDASPDLIHTGLGLSLRIAYTFDDGSPYHWSIPVGLELLF